MIVPPNFLELPNQSVLRLSQQRSTLDQLKGIFRPKRRPGSTRGPVCLITPGMRPEQMPFSDTPSVLSDRPLFVWRTPVARVQVQLAKNKQVVWNQILPEGTQRVVYQGQPLEAGKTYQVIAFGRQGDPLNVGEDAQFTLLSTDEREEMLQRLMALETDLDNQQKSAETIAIAKAIELSNSSLFSDAYQVLDALPQKSPQLTNFLANLPASICGKQYEAGSFRLPNTTN